MRPLGKAELLVEASFADMRHRGDGDLSLAYKLVQKVSLSTLTLISECMQICASIMLSQSFCRM